MVTAATFRAPSLLIKAVTTLDVLSAGRAWLGIGAGYNGDEARAMGLFLPETAERFARMTELLRLARQMWDGDETPFRGEYLDLEHPVGSPRPITTPPVLIGGTGERRTLRLGAEFGDACNLFDVPDGGRQRAPVFLLARFDARYVMGQDQDADMCASRGVRGLFDRRMVIADVADALHRHLVDQVLANHGVHQSTSPGRQRVEALAR